MQDRRILQVEGPIAAGTVGTLDIALPSGGTLHSVSIFPTGVSIDPTTVSVLLYDPRDVLVTSIIGRGTASSSATHPFAAVEYPHLPLPRDRIQNLRAVIYNSAAVAVTWRMVAGTERIE